MLKTLSRRDVKVMIAAARRDLLEFLILATSRRSGEDQWHTPGESCPYQSVDWTAGDHPAMENLQQIGMTISGKSLSPIL